MDPETKRYVTRNEIGIPDLERDFDLTVRNDSHFGASTIKGERLLDRMLERGGDCGGAGGRASARRAPSQVCQAVPGMIGKLRRRDIVPILTTLPPLEPRLFFNWWCGRLDQAAVRRWLGSDCNIYAHQERYSRAVERLAWEENVPLVDIRGAFLDHWHLDTLLCEDGTHPNSAGQALIGQAFRDFAERWEAGVRCRTAR